MKTFRASLADMHVSPLWDVFHDLITPTPEPGALPQKWNYQDIRPLLMESGRRITAAEAERRVLILENAGLPNKHTVTDSLYAGVQLVLPGEAAPVHRHSQSALRFVLEGNDGVTIVNGSAFPMKPFDLILTPNWSWHEHIGGQSPTIWLDGLDIPIVAQHAANFAETGAAVNDATVRDADPTPYTATVESFAPRTRESSSSGNQTEHQQTLYFPYSVWRDVLDEKSRRHDICPHTGWSIDFINPVCGDSVLHTISAQAHKFPAGSSTSPRRGTENSISTVVEGSAVIKVGDEEYNVAARDVFSIPCWSPVTIDVGPEGLVLFRYSDQACQQRLGLWREERS